MESALRDYAPEDLRVFETMLWTPEKGVHRVELHLARLARGCERLGITAGNIGSILSVLEGAGPQRLRLSVGLDNDVRIETWDFVPLPAETVWRVAIAKERVLSEDPWLRVKTTNRELYNRLRANLPEGVDEVIVLNERDEVCEGTITNVFVDTKGSNGLVTPPPSCGLLPGILRESVIRSGEAKEAILCEGDLLSSSELLVGNSLRGLIKAELVV